MSMVDTVIYQGTLQDIATKRDTKDGKYVEVKLLQKGHEHPITLRAWGASLVERFDKARKGMEIAFDVEDRQGEYQGKPVTYHNIVGIRKAEEGEEGQDGPLFPPADGEGAGKGKEAPAGRQGAGAAASRRTPPAPQAPKVDPERVSIEAQVAVKVAAGLLEPILVTAPNAEAMADAVDVYLDRFTKAAMAAIQGAKA